MENLDAAVNIKNAQSIHDYGTVGTAGTYTPAETSANTSSQLFASTVNEPGNDMQIYNLH